MGVHMTYTASVFAILIVFYLVQVSDYRQLLDDAGFLKEIVQKKVQEQLRRFSITKRGVEADSHEHEERMNEDSAAAQHIDIVVPLDEPGQAAEGKHLGSPCACTSEQRAAASPKGHSSP